MNRNDAPLFDSRVADWLEEDPDLAPREALEVVLAAFPSIKQRRPRVPWRSFDLPLDGSLRVRLAQRWPSWP